MAADKWVVTTTGDRDLSDVVGDARAAGFTVDEILDAIGVVTGTAGNDVATALRAIPGVADVSPDQPIDIGQPEADETW